MFQKRGQFVSEGVNLYKIIIIMTSRVLLMGGMGITVLAKQTPLHREWDMFSMGKVMTQFLNHL